MIQDQRRDHLPADHGGDERAGAKPWGEHDNQRDVDRAQQAAGPLPPRRVRPCVRKRYRNPKPDDGDEQGGGSDAERDQRRRQGTAEEIAELGVGAGLDRQQAADEKRKQEKTGHTLCPRI